MAQIQQPVRFEILLNEGDQPYEVVSAGERGVLLYKELPNAYNNKNKIWHIVVLDTALNVLWEKEYFIQKEYALVSHQLHEEAFYMMFARSSSSSQRLELMKIDLNSGYFTSRAIKSIVPIGISGFEMISGAVLISGYFNYRPVVFYYNFSKGIPKVLPGIFDDRRELVQVKVNEQTFDVVLAGITYDKRNTLFVKTFDHEGNLLKNVSLNTHRGKGLIFGKAQNKGEAQLVAGIYGLRNSEYSRGVFVASIDQVGDHQIKFYNYGDFDNFFNYMRDRRERRVKNRIARRKIKNKKLKFNYRLLVHDIKENDKGQHILLGEAFYPKYRTVTGNYNGIYAPVSTFDNGILRSNRIFEGYRYTHAVVIGFDSDGKMLWDNSFEINNIISFELEQFVNISVKGDKIVLLYIHDNVIHSKVIKEGQVVEEKTPNKIRLKFENDYLVDTKAEVNGIKPWYDDTFYAYGVHKVSNFKDSNVQVKRKVFFINKVIYE